MYTIVAHIYIWVNRLDYCTVHSEVLSHLVLGPSSDAEKLYASYKSMGCFVPMSWRCALGQQASGMIRDPLMSNMNNESLSVTDRVFSETSAWQDARFIDLHSRNVPVQASWKIACEATIGRCGR
jgi:hypothetical protein